VKEMLGDIVKSCFHDYQVVPSEVLKERNRCHLQAPEYEVRIQALSNGMYCNPLKLQKEERMHKYIVEDSLAGLSASNSTFAVDPTKRCRSELSKYTLPFQMACVLQ